MSSSPELKITDLRTIRLLMNGSPLKGEVYFKILPNESIEVKVYLRPVPEKKVIDSIDQNPFHKKGSNC
jgi:hypothetical protein